MKKTSISCSKEMTENFNKSDAVYYFGTFLVDLIYPKAGMTGIELIQSEGVGLIFPYNKI
ncbi:MAG: hypothetical protein CL935_02005 [Deltaproteobacteria bacterium]|mgnify:CR=1 FL=1|nr:hypothetical protein [Deltaproteobacteria bacterium]|tara:strand:- start:328 stop:507 length:180 start_codon:yes stop_codon:yes gene_type:complete